MKKESTFRKTKRIVGVILVIGVLALDIYIMKNGCFDFSISRIFLND